MRQGVVLASSGASNWCTHTSWQMAQTGNSCVLLCKVSWCKSLHLNWATSSETKTMIPFIHYSPHLLFQSSEKGIWMKLVKIITMDFLMFHFLLFKFVCLLFNPIKCSQSIEYINRPLKSSIQINIDNIRWYVITHHNRGSTMGVSEIIGNL